MPRLIILFALFIFTLPLKATDYTGKAAKLYASGRNNYLNQNYKLAVADFENAIVAIGEDSVKNIIVLSNIRAFLANAYWNNVQCVKSDNMARLCYNQLLKYPDPGNPGLFDAYLHLSEFYIRRDYSYDINDFLIENLSRIVVRYYPDDSSKMGLLYFVKGYFAMAKEDTENAIYYLTRSTELLKDMPDLNRYVTFNHVHMSYVKIIMNDFQGTIEYVNNVLNLRETTPDGRLLLYEPLAVAYWKLADTIRMQEYFRSAIKSASIYSTSSSTYITSRSYYYLNFFAKNPKDQLNYLRESLDYARKMYDKGKVLAMLYMEIGDHYHRSNEPLKALRYIQKAIIASSVDFNDTSVISNPPLEKLMNYSDLVQILFHKGLVLPEIDTYDRFYTKHSIKCFELAFNLLDKQLCEIGKESPELNLIELRRHILGYLVTYSNFVYRNTGEEEYARKAFYYSEKAKVQVLKRSTEKAEILRNCGVPDSLIEKSNRLGNKILQTGNIIALKQQKGKDISGLLKEITFLNDQRDFLNYKLQKEFPQLQKTGFIPHIPGIEEIQSVLEPDQALIEYEISWGAIITFVITKDMFYQYYQEIYYEPDNHIENLRKLVSSDPTIDNSDSTFLSFVKSSGYLYDLLIRPVYGKIKGKRLIIIPQGSLVLIPFEVLISNKYDGRNDYSKLHWLIEEFPVTYAFSASYLVEKKDQEYGKQMAAFMPDYKNASDNLAYLKGAANEAKFLKRKLGFRVYSGKRYGERNFRKRSSGLRLIHIAAHTEINDIRPDLSGFILNEPETDSTDGRLYAFEIKQMKLNAQLAVLNGCNTGYGTLKRGEGLVSLGRSFFFTGIRTVAFTLWQVSDLSAHDLVIRFYKEIYRGQPTDLALMRSKTAFIKNADPVKAHPYYWAGFIVYGKSQVIPIKHDYTKWVAMFLLLLAVITAFMVLKDSHSRSNARISSDRSE